MTYDEWRLSGPDERQEPEMIKCEQCDGTGIIRRFTGDEGVGCHVCGGSGEVPVEAEEPEAREMDE